MPSTYTRNSGIEKIGSGEQSGTWGDTTNDNFDIIDRSINGVLTLVLSGTSSTITTSDGTLSDGQFKVLILSGTLSATHTITISPNDAQKLYFVRNTTSQTVIFTQGSGGNASVLSGASAAIYATGAGSASAVVSISDTFSTSGAPVTGGTITGSNLVNVTLTSVSSQSGARTAIGAQATITGAATTITSSDLTASRVLVSDGSGKVSASSTASSLLANVIPSGGIIMWSGSIVSIPSGWALCNGSNGTPDLRDRFVVGAGSTYAVGTTGGAATVALTQANLPAHSHTFSGTTSVAGAHTHAFNTGRGDGVGFANPDGVVARSADTAPVFANFGTSISGDHSHTFSGTTSSIGSGTAHENLPPYYALAYIMKL